jgi:hypothetical protein
VRGRLRCLSVEADRQTFANPSKLRLAERPPHPRSLSFARPLPARGRGETNPSHSHASKDDSPVIAARHCERSEAIQRMCKRPLDCFVASAPRNDARHIANPSRSRASFFAQAVVRMALKSLPSRGEQELPFSSSKLLEGLPFEASAKKGSGTPASPGSTFRIFSGCGDAHIAARADLSAFHSRLSPEGRRSQRLRSRPGFLGLGFTGCYPVSPVPVQWQHPTHRS